MTRVVDTSVLIDLLRGDARARELLLAAVDAGAELQSSVIVRAEVLAGMRPGEERETMALLDTVAWLDVTTDVADLAAAHGRRYRRSHPGVDLADYLIAATTELAGATLLTLNTKHFPMIAGLVRAYD